jgi:valacyclovir hydrolase
MPFLLTGHTELYYDILPTNITTMQQSTSHPILLLHGFAGTPQSDFTGQLPLLTLHYTVLAPHLHGYGHSSHRTSYGTHYYREDVADLVALLDVLFLKQVYVLGFSDGGITALLLAALHPQRVAALAVLGAQATINTRDVAAIRSWLLEKPLSPEWQEELARLHGDPYWRSLPALYVQAQEDLVESGGVLISEQELATISCPTLIMHGTRDRVVAVEYAHMLHERIPSSHLLLFDAGHAAHLRCQDEYNAAILRFFQHPDTFTL